MTGIHARCLANRQTASQLLICGRSRGHRNPEHYDPDADQYWTDDPHAGCYQPHIGPDGYTDCDGQPL